MGFPLLFMKVKHSASWANQDVVNRQQAEPSSASTNQRGGKWKSMVKTSYHVVTDKCVKIERISRSFVKIHSGLLITDKPLGKSLAKQWKFKVPFQNKPVQTASK